jgi:hypothetical protein
MTVGSSYVDGKPLVTHEAEAKRIPLFNASISGHRSPTGQPGEE